MLILFIKISCLSPYFSIESKLHESLLSWESTDLEGAVFHARGLTYTLKIHLHKIYKLCPYTFLLSWKTDGHLEHDILWNVANKNNLKHQFRIVDNSLVKFLANYHLHKHSFCSLTSHISYDLLFFAFGNQSNPTQKCFFLTQKYE